MSWLAALAALICFLLVLLGVAALGPLSLSVLGFVCLALWALLSSAPWPRR